MAEQSLTLMADLDDESQKLMAGWYDELKAAGYDEDFMFQLTKDEAESLSRCNNFTLNMKTKRGSNIKYLPYAFTEQGIYMLMTVLKGTLATQQSKSLIRVFKTIESSS